MKKILFNLILIPIFIFTASAQIGIGNSPNANAILDLSNSGGKYLLLPAATLTPTSALLTDSASMIYFNGNIYYNNGTSNPNVLSPWDWDGTYSGSISSPSGVAVGIGIDPTSSFYRLQVADAASPGVSSTGFSKASIGIGNTAFKHLEIDKDEIMVKINANTPDTIKLQKEGGKVEIGMSTLPVSEFNDILRVNGNIDAINKGKMREQGFDLLPSGSIMMWNSASPPPGWTLCNGVPQTNPITGLTFTPPNLMEQFIVGVGSSYGIGDNGGTISSDHTHQVILQTNIDTNNGTADGTHKHKGTTGTSSSSLNTCTTAATSSFGAGSTNGHTHLYTTDLDGAHKHTITFPEFTSGAASNTENRPPYYALVYIMKY